MKTLLITLALALPITTHSAATPIQCSQAADMLHAILNGQRFDVPAFAIPLLEKAAEHVMANQGQRDPYWHSTVLFMECLRTGGDVAKMYDPRFVVDPSRLVRRS
jgi:hypothetical protein